MHKELLPFCSLCCWWHINSTVNFRGQVIAWLSILVVWICLTYLAKVNQCYMGYPCSCSQLASPKAVGQYIVIGCSVSQTFSSILKVIAISSTILSLDSVNVGEVDFYGCNFLGACTFSSPLSFEAICFHFYLDFSCKHSPIQVHLQRRLSSISAFSLSNVKANNSLHQAIVGK